MTKRETDRAAAALAVTMALFLAALVFGLAAALSGCQASEPEPPPAFVGKWADDSRPPFLFMVEFRPDHSVTFSVRDAGELISRQDGEWSYRPPLLITRDTACQEGPPVRLVPCQAEPDTVRPAVAGDAWPLSFEQDGEIISFDLRRVQ